MTSEKPEVLEQIARYIRHVEGHTTAQQRARLFLGALLYDNIGAPPEIEDARARARAIDHKTAAEYQAALLRELHLARHQVETAPHECTSWTAADIARHSGKSLRHIQRLMKNCGVGTPSPNGPGRPVLLLSEDDLDRLLDEDSDPQ